MESETLIDKISRLIEQAKNCKAHNEELMRENTVLKAQNEAKEIELTRINDRLIERERELAEIGRQIDGLLG